MAKAITEKTEQIEKSDQNIPPVEARKPATGVGFRRLAILCFLLLVVILECGAAYLLIPVAPPLVPNADLESVASNIVQKSGEGNDSAPEPDAQTGIEVNLGEFSVTSYQPTTNTTLRIDFHLYGVIESDKKEEFDMIFAANNHRFRDIVISSVRSAQLADLTDTGLALIKRQVLEKTNRLLKKPYLNSIIVSDFSFIEQ